MARVSAPRVTKPTQPKRVAAPTRATPPPKRDSFTGQVIPNAPGMGDVQRRTNGYTPLEPSINLRQMEQNYQARQSRAMPDRNTPAGYVSPYNQQQNTQAMFAAPYMAAYGPKYAPTMANVNQVGQYTPSPAARQNAASAGRYNAQYQVERWQPDKAAAQKYTGYGSPSYGLTNAPQSARSLQATADRYTAQAAAYFNPTPDNGGGGGGYSGWTDYGGGGGGGGGGYDRPPEWYERMINWKF